jgi:hypothetical protein
MFAFAYQTKSRTAVVVLAAIAALGVASLATPAFAVDGRTAVGMCIDGTAKGLRCGFSVNDKGEIDICNKNGCVYCKSATDQCTMARQGRPKPTRPLPAGATVNTKLGAFEVGAKGSPGDPVSAVRGK